MVRGREGVRPAALPVAPQMAIDSQLILMRRPGGREGRPPSSRLSAPGTLHPMTQHPTRVRATAEEGEGSRRTSAGRQVPPRPPSPVVRDRPTPQIAPWVAAVSSVGTRADRSHQGATTAPRERPNGPRPSRTCDRTRRQFLLAAATDVLAPQPTTPHAVGTLMAPEPGVRVRLGGVVLGQGSAPHGRPDVAGRSRRGRRRARRVTGRTWTRRGADPSEVGPRSARSPDRQHVRRREPVLIDDLAQQRFLGRQLLLMTSVNLCIR